MLIYILRRLLLAIPTLIGMTAVVFFVMALSPGGTGAALLSKEGQLKPQEREAIKAYLEKRYGLDKPLPVQYLRWLDKISPVGVKERSEGFPESSSFGFKAPDLGDSMIRSRKVSALILEALPVTLLLNAMSLPLIYVFSLILGIKAAKERGKFLDVGTGTVLLALWSFPTILAGLLLQGYLASKEFAYIFPAAGMHDMQADRMPFLPTFSGGWNRGWVVDTLMHLVLPVVCMTYGGFAFLAKLSRGSMLENIASDYVRTARAKGVNEKDVLYRHVFRNSLIPLITFAAHLLPALISGAIVVETIFSVPGMGRLGVESIFLKDREVVLGVALVSGLLGLISYLLADICYALADPRVAFE